ncbi:hypothetical protein RMN56_06075 [Micromonospora halotolerans]|uniref:Uncharacterized protein n=1 Tax=Micromonospora halotolerans TaxID=709879 RepID=A0ABZ0A117_9ACTN|nr:hypothetical protein [Micromonospora halotolerans]WNM40915.1 hypothetical protein RMN56_06075 [Micromonospora halotolerans]
MLAGLEVPPAVEAGRVITAVLAGLHSGSHSGVVFDSPPRAGKSTQVVRVAVEMAAAGEPLIIIGQTGEHVNDLIDRLAQKASDPGTGRFSAAVYTPSERVKGHETVRFGANVADLGGPAVIIGTAAKRACFPAPALDAAKERAKRRMFGIKHSVARWA